LTNLSLGIIENYHADYLEWACFLSSTFYWECTLFLFTRSCWRMYWSGDENAGELQQIAFLL